MSRNPPLLTSLPLALSIGTLIVGVSSFVFVTRHYGWGWGLATGLVGAIAGAIWSLDALIPGPGKDISSERSSGMRVGPFGGTVQFTAATIGCLAAAAYVWGSHAVYLERLPGGQVDLLRDESWWLGMQHTLVREPDVRRVDDSRGSELIFYREEDQQHLSFVSDCPAGTAAQVTQFLTDSTAARFDLPRRNWSAWVTPLFAVLAIVCGWLALRSLRWGLQELQAVWAEKPANSAD